jgi:hypothetical protein
LSGKEGYVTWEFFLVGSGLSDRPEVGHGDLVGFSIVFDSHHFFHNVVISFRGDEGNFSLKNG